MKLVAYVIDGHPFEIRPAPLERDWMEKTDQRFVYRCLPRYYRGLDPGGAPAKISNHRTRLRLRDFSK
jgi:hypothetical protein